MTQVRTKNELTNDALLADLLWKLRLKILAYNGQSIDIRELRKDAIYREKWLNMASASGDIELESLAQSIQNRIKTLIDEQDAYRTVNSVDVDDSPVAARLPWLIAAVAVLASIAFYLFQSPFALQSDTASPLAATQLNRQSQTPSTMANSEQAADLLFRMHGSNTIGEKLAPALVVDFLRTLGATDIKYVKTQVEVENDVVAQLDGKPVRVEIHAHGSTTGFVDLTKEATDIAMASRKIKTKEVDNLTPLFGDLSQSSSEYILALDGLAVITHPSLPFERLESSVIARLFSGDIRNWQDIGGPDLPVKVLARDENSGTWDSFSSMILKPNKRQLTIDAARIESSHTLSDSVASTPGAIGFIGLPYVRRSKLIAVAEDKGSLPIFPTSFTVGTEDYPLARRLYFYLPANSSNTYAHQFVEYAIGNAGQKTVQNVGLISQNIIASKPTPTDEMPSEYLAMTRNAQRLSLNFRFEPNSDKIDNKGQRDMKRLVGYLQNHPSNNVMLLGFTDSIGEPAVNMHLSKARAELVGKEFMMRGIIPSMVTGFGESVPVASNTNEDGRNRNRRVEVWIK